MTLQQVQRSVESTSAYWDALATYRETGDQHREGIALQELEQVRADGGPDTDG